MKNKINWGLVFINTLLILWDCFFIWFNTSFALEYYHGGHFNLAAVFVLGTIIWSFCLYRDLNDIKNEPKNSPDVTISIKSEKD